jgi:hypothetical protein
MLDHDTKPSRAECSHVGTCELFPKFGLRGSLGVWKTFYCTGNFEGCARYQAALAGQRVEPNLLPNGKSLDLKALGI